MNKRTKRIGGLITTFMDDQYLDLSIKSIITFVDKLVIVEGSYLNMQRPPLNYPPFSTDMTYDIINDWIAKDKENKIILIGVNKEDDKDQRNVGLTELIKEKMDYLLICDSDEYMPLSLLSLAQATIESQYPPMVCYFKSLTMINDFSHYCWQSFPRLYNIKEGNPRFTDDNYMTWDFSTWQDAPKKIIDLSYYVHFSYVRGEENFLRKKRWWEERLKEKNFHFDWNLINGKIVPENHPVYTLPEIPAYLKIELAEHKKRMDELKERIKGKK